MGLEHEIDNAGVRFHPREWDEVADELFREKVNSEWAAIKHKDKPVPQSNTSSKTPSMFCWFERNRQITIFRIAAITAIIVAYILKPARYKPLGGNSSSVLDTETGLIYPRGTGSSPMKKW